MDLLLNKRIKENYKDINLPKVGTLLKNILRISIPAAAETLLVGIIGLVDTIMVGSLGKEALAAVSLSQQPVFITLAACMGMNAGVTAIISRRRGENDKEGARKTLKQCILLGIFVSIVITILAIIFAKPFLLFTGAEEDTIGLATTYFQIVSSVLIFNYVRLIICAGLRAVGDTKVTLITNLTANIINLFFNYCLINGNLGFPKLGVQGAAIATAIGNTVAFIICILIIRFRKGFLNLKLKEDWRYDSEYAGNIIRVSSSAFIEQLFMRIGFYIIAMIVNRLGTTVVAENAIISGVISLAFNITDGFAVGSGALVGKSLGEKNPPLAFAYGRFSQILSLFMGCIMVSLIITFRIPLSSLFSKDQEVVKVAGHLLLFASFVVFPQSLQWVTTGILRGAGDVKYTARTAMISIMIIRPLFSYVLCLYFGLLGSWIGMFLDQTIRFLMNNYRFTHLKWVKIEV